MKRFLTAAAAVSLLAAGAAYAQTAPSGSTPDQSGAAAPQTGGMTPDQSGAAQGGAMTQGGSTTDQSGAMQGGSMPQGGSTTDQSGAMQGGSMPQGGAAPDQSGAMQGGSTTDQSGAMQGGAAAGGMSTSTGAAETADTPSTPPSNYPPCTSRGQDRCVQSAGTQRKLRKEYGGKHVARRMQHHKAAVAASTPDATAPATPQ